MTRLTNDPKRKVDELRACARGKPKVGAAQGFGGSDANVFHDRHGLDHRDVQGRTRSAGRYITLPDTG